MLKYLPKIFISTVDEMKATGRHLKQIYMGLGRWLHDYKCSLPLRGAKIQFPPPLASYNYL